MTLKIFHTGDIHLGMLFNSYPAEVREKLVEARFASLENMINISNDREADIFLVAGDMFNTIKVGKKHIYRAVKILNKFNGACVLLLPGNHDYDNEAIDLWDEFMRGANEKLVLLNDGRPFNLQAYGIDAIIYPAHCHSKHSSSNNLGWIKEKGILQEGKYHIGIGHGALEGLSADLEGNYYPMTMKELEDIGTDLWLLGHTHVPFPMKDTIRNNKIFNAGTPEPDGLDFKYEGSAWYISLNDKGNFAERILTGHYKFIDRDFHIEIDDRLDEIEDWILSTDPGNKIIRIRLSGSISKEAYEGLNNFYTRLYSKVFHLIIDDNDLKIKMDIETIEKEFTKGSFPYEFLNNLIDDEEAVQIAYDLIRR